MGAVVDNKRAIKIARFLMMASTMTGALALATAARAGDEPLYQPIPEWVDKSEADKQLQGASAVKKGLVIVDKQARIEKGTVTTYFDIVYNIDTPEMMTQAGMLNGAWNPAHGDFIVHRVEILRGNERINALASDRKFEVLRREEALSQFQLTGILTAMFQVDGLRIGDRLRFTGSQTRTDPITGVRGEFIGPLVAKPAQAHFAQTRISWPVSEALKWAVRGKDALQNFAAGSGRKDNILTITEPLPEQPSPAAMAPRRYMVPPLVEVSGFTDWKDVSRTNAKLYVTDGLISESSPLAIEADKIATSTSNQKERAAKALELVQREVRYLFNGMGNGNYVPQSPDKTWELRYGDCKAKTILLLALLHRLDIEAVPAMVNTSFQDGVSERLPSFGAFDHVIVKAKIGNETYWLDGTRNGDRLADLNDVPDFRYALPSTAEGNDLEAITFRPKARPDVDYELTIDAGNGLAFPAPFKARQILRGDSATMLRMADGMIDEEKFKETVNAFLKPDDDSYVTESKITFNDADGTVLIEGAGLKTFSTVNEDSIRKLSLKDFITNYDPQASRGKADWANIPFAPSSNEYSRRKVTFTLPNGGKGMTLENNAGYQVDLAAYQLQRSISQTGDKVEIIDIMRRSAWELPFDKYLADKSKLSLLNKKVPKVALPVDYPAQWLEQKNARVSGKYAPIVKLLDAAVLASPKDTSPVSNRAQFYQNLGLYGKAVPDLTRMIALEPTAYNHYWRSWLLYREGEYDAAEADVRKALQIDSEHDDSYLTLSNILEKTGRVEEALQLADQRAELGTNENDVVMQKANILDGAGRYKEALTELDALNDKKPSVPSVLNGLCWIKARNDHDLQTALKQCTKALELGDQPAAYLDSRGLVFYRMKRYEEALADYDAALRISPDQGSSYMGRGLTKIALGKKAEGDADIAAAKELDADAVAEFAKVGLKP